MTEIDPMPITTRILTAWTVLALLVLIIAFLAWLWGVMSGKVFLQIGITTVLIWLGTSVAVVILVPNRRR